MERTELPETENLRFWQQGENGYLEAQAYGGRRIEVRFCARLTKEEFNKNGEFLFSRHAVGAPDGRFYIQPHQIFSGYEAVCAIRDGLNELIAFYDANRTPGTEEP